MNFFFDTNVCIGYIFRWNPWHEKAKSLFNQEKESYWSVTVKEECAKVFQDLVQEYTIFLINIKERVDNSDKGSFFKSDLHKMIKNMPVTLNRQLSSYLNEKLTSLKESLKLLAPAKNFIHDTAYFSIYTLENQIIIFKIQTLLLPFFLI